MLVSVYGFSILLFFIFCFLSHSQSFISNLKYLFAFVIFFSFSFSFFMNDCCVSEFFFSGRTRVYLSYLYFAACAHSETCFYAILIVSRGRCVYGFCLCLLLFCCWWMFVPFHSIHIFINWQHSTAYTHTVAIHFTMPRMQFALLYMHNAHSVCNVQLSMYKCKR